MKNKKINLDNELFTCINSKYKPTIIKYLNQSTIGLVELERETLVVGADLFQQTSSNLNNPTGKYLFIGDSITVANWYKYSSLTGSARCAVGGGQATHILKYLESNCTLDSFIVCDNQKGCNAQKYNFTNFSDYETAVIHLGVNDLGITAVTPEILENRIQNIINFLNKQGIKKIILLTTIPTTTLTKNNEKMKASNAWIKGLNGINGITVVDASAAFYNNGVVNTNYFSSSDGVHPNDAGKKAMSEALDNVINNSEELLAYEGELDESFNALAEPLNPFLTASTNFSGSYLSKYLIPKNMINNYTNNIPVNTTYLNNKNLKKENRDSFGFVVLHDGGDIPGCKTKFPNDIENCVVRNIINGSWKNSGLSTHYYIGCSGEIFKLVSEEYIAYHAGCKSSYCVLKGMNNISIGIDLRNCHRYTENSIPYTEAQHNALNLLLLDLKTRGIVSNLNDETIVGHFEVLKYKNDPLPGFNWLNTTGILVDHRTLRDSSQETPFQIATKKELISSNIA